MARRLVELHGGRVWAESEGEGKGSTFVVRLPQATAVPTAFTHAASPGPSTVSRRILVVDDNVDAAKMLSVLLELDRHIVRRAATAAEALEILRTFKAQIALLDIGLPGGMSGLDLARAIRADGSLEGILLVAVTGWGQDEDLRRSREAGFDRHLTKPTEAEELAEVIESYGRKHTTS
jgi:CheY-like chemotaxis protein